MTKRLWTVSLAAMLTLPLMAGPVLAQPELGKQKRSGPIKWPECYCTDKNGARHELGDIICLSVGGRSFEAKCVMAQNNPFWRDQNRDCVVGEAPQMTPFPRELAFAD
ncbi:MAG: hypothetical protein OXR62_00045 [Ahrensia sp.]|nr:hypothetical protein [Ahrensia sp.]